MTDRRAEALLVILLFCLSLPLAAANGASATASSATSLSVTIVPPTLPADGQTHAVVVVSLVDQKGRETVALNDTLVYLTSSQEDVATVQNLAMIPVGQSYVLANATMTLTPGTTTITASSVGLGSAYANLVTMTPSGFPTSLAVFSSPPAQPLGQNEGQLVVEVLDQVGRPTRAASATQILITSSNDSVASPSVSSFILPVNDTVAVVDYTSDAPRPTPGTATFTATATGFNAGYSQVTVENTTGGSPAGLALQANPGQLIADGRSYDALTVMLRNANGSATASPAGTGGILVQLTSSQPSILSVPPAVLIPAGKTYVLVKATSTVSPGSATVTATSIGLASASAAIDTVTPAPSQLALYIAPQDAVVTSGGTRATLFVQLQDGDGNPALGRRATNVVITSSNTTLADSAQKFSIPRGEDYGVISLLLKGTSNGVLTAVSPGLKSSAASLTSFMAAFQAQLTSASYSIYANETVKVSVTASALGAPLKGAPVTWNSSAGSFVSEAGSTGTDGTATAIFRPSASGGDVITATLVSKAFGSANLTTSIYVLPTPVKQDPTLLQRILSYWLYIAVAAAGGVVAASVFLVRRRRKKASSSEEEFGLSS